ncbi:MAG: DUF6174 domain-containing protein, partial [Actinomycetota bacterium]|nr:DUF6174 domain-containing protein [Actinomycetota bacterium]
MKTGARILLSLAILLILGACGEPAPTSDSPTTSTTTPLAEPEEPAMEIISVTACKQTDPWTMVETAFKGTVTAIEPPATGIEGDTMQVVSFEVGAWYTADFGTTFSMWAPNFEGTAGEEWLIGGALYYSLGQQSGEVFPCVSTPATQAARQEWEARYGPPVPAGSGVPEGEPDPALVAQIEEQRAKWLAAGIDDYTAVISVYTRIPQTEPCGGGSSIRVTVEDGIPTEAIDVMRFCTLEDPTTMHLIDDLFDLALTNAGAITDPIDFDPELGYIRSFYASDRSVETGAYVEVLHPRVVDAVVGTQQAMDAAAAAIATWQTAGIEDYTY